MTLEVVFRQVLAQLPSIAEVVAVLARALRRLVAHARAVAGPLGFTQPGDAPVVVTAGRGRLPAELDAWLQASVRTPVGRPALARGTPPRWTRGRAGALKTPPLASGARRGALLLPWPLLTPGRLAAPLPPGPA